MPTASKKPLKIAVCGLGFMGSTHLKALKNVKEAELVAVVSDVPQKLTGDLSAIQGNLGGPGEKWDFSHLKKYNNVYDAIRDKDIDAVDLCLPTHLHKPVTIEALRAGKHVLVEKPMALDGAECDEMVEEGEESGRVLMVAQVLRFFPEYVSLRETLWSKTLGEVRAAIFRRRCAGPTWQRWVYDKSRSGGGVFDLVIHDVDFCLQVFGQPEAISAIGYEKLENGVDWLTGTLYYPNIPGGIVIQGGWHHPKTFPFSMEYSVVADGATLEYSSAGRPATQYNADAETPMDVKQQDGYEAELRYFAECCVEGKKPEFCPPSESSLAVKLCLALVAARSENGRRLEWRG